VARFLKTWETAVEAKGISFNNPYHEIAGAAIWEAWPDMCKTLDGLVPQQLKYDITSDVEGIRHLQNDLLLAITPNEVRSRRGLRPAAVASIYNAGWRAYLGGIGQLAEANRWSPSEAKAKLNQWIAKGIELAEVQTRWGEVK
jgi:hypothetical protein